MYKPVRRPPCHGTRRLDRSQCNYAHGYVDPGHALDILKYLEPYSRTIGVVQGSRFK